MQKELSEGWVFRDSGPELEEVHNVLPYHTILIIPSIEIDDAWHNFTAYLGATLLVNLR